MARGDGAPGRKATAARRGSLEAQAAPPITVGQLATSVLGRRALGACPAWPADVFAVASVLLRRTGAYVDVVERWRPPPEWAKHTRDVADRWREAWAAGAPPPREVQLAWRGLTEHRHLTVEPFQTPPTLVEVLLRLSSYSDETEAAPPPGHPMTLESELALTLRGNLGREVHPRTVTVLPKTHTARVGLTLRSLSHHLAALHGLDVSAQWIQRPWRPRVERISLLLLPWPMTVTPRTFHAVREPRRAPFVPGHASFRYAPPDFDLRSAARAFDEAKALGGAAPDVVVLPEQTITKRSAEAFAARTGAIVVAGIHGGTEPRRNASLVCDPYGASGTDVGVSSFEQPKHHRWCLDAGQIRRYGLTAQLDPSQAHQYWEDIELGPRALRVHALDRELTYSVLVCEDLARQDAVAEMVRELGPSLVIALLLDGPQLKGRWPARYAGSLAEDPGCSVLTLTSYGMSQLSRPPSPAIALFGDGATGEIVELSLAPGAIGLLVTLVRATQTEHTVDGRLCQRAGLRLESVLDVHARAGRGRRRSP